MGIYLVDEAASAASISAVILDGLSFVPQRLIGIPLRSIKNLVQFHLMELVMNPLQFGCDCKNWNSGVAFLPFTSALSKKLLWAG